MSIFDWFESSNPWVASASNEAKKTQAAMAAPDKAAQDAEDARLKAEWDAQQIQQMKETPWAPFGAYTPGSLSSMLSSWMPGQTADPTYQNKYAPWSWTDWGGAGAMGQASMEDILNAKRSTEMSQAEEGTSRSAPGAGQSFSAGDGRVGAPVAPPPQQPPPQQPPPPAQGAPPQGIPAQAAAGPAQPFNPNFLSSAMVGYRPEYLDMFGRGPRRR